MKIAEIAPNLKAIISYRLKIVDQSQSFQYSQRYQKKLYIICFIITLQKRCNLQLRVKSFEISEYMLEVFIDLKKPFDAVNHEILLHKLKLYEIAVHFQNDSKVIFRTEINASCITSIITSKKSVYLDILCGVLQGSILGPLFFLTS